MRPHVRCDLADGEAVRWLIRREAPDVVIHAQAMADVDACQQQPAQAWRQNLGATTHLCAALEAHGARAILVAVSSDYVFDGAKGAPYDETDAPRPLSVYGRTKAAMESRVRRYPRGVVVRLSTLFGAGRTNFCEQVVERLKARRRVEAFTDQTTSPSLTDDVARGMYAIVRRLGGLSRLEGQPRIYHVANAGGCSRLTLATRIARELGASTTLIRPIRMADQARPAPRPASSVLTSRYLSAVMGSDLRPWDHALHAYLRDRR